MINVCEVIKKIRSEYNLTQEQFGRAIGYEGSTVSKWESGSRVPDIITLHEVVQNFGYDLELSLKEKVGNKKDVDFYKEKTYSDIFNMDIKDLVDYIFVTQDNLVISNICNVGVESLEYIPLNNLKELIEFKIKDTDRLAVHFMIKEFWLKAEKEMAQFIHHINYHLANLSNISKDLLDKIDELEVSTSYYRDNYFNPEGYHYFDYIKAFDKDGKNLNIPKDDIDGDQVPLDDSIDFELGEYLKEEITSIKLHY